MLLLCIDDRLPAVVHFACCLLSPAALLYQPTNRRGVELSKLTRGMLYGKLELLGKGIFTMEGTKVVQDHTIALCNALVHSTVIKMVDFHRNHRVPYECVWILFLLFWWL